MVISEDDNLRALIPIAKRLTVKISLPVLTTKVYRGRVSNTRMRGERSNRLHHCNTEKNACKTKTKKWTNILLFKLSYCQIQRNLISGV